MTCRRIWYILSLGKDAILTIGIIDVGGGLRGIYGVGIFDYCLDKNISFDCCIGVSAGSANIASYLAGQRGRNLKFYTEYAFRREYMSGRNFLRTGSYIDLDYVYSTLANSGGENPIDYGAMLSSRSLMYVVALNALTGQTKYFDKNDISFDKYDIFKASSCIPVVCRPYRIDGVPYYDGGIADPVPVQKAFDAGCDKVVVVLTKTRDTIRTPGRDVYMSKLIRHKYPNAARHLAMRYKAYNDGVSLAKKYETEGKVLILAPDDLCGMDTLTKDKAKLFRLYKKGYADAEMLHKFIES